jgi:hypothetical protein
LKEKDPILLGIASWIVDVVLGSRSSRGVVVNTSISTGATTKAWRALKNAILCLQNFFFR